MNNPERRVFIPPKEVPPRPESKGRWAAVETTRQAAHEKIRQEQLEQQKRAESEREARERIKAGISAAGEIRDYLNDQGNQNAVADILEHDQSTLEDDERSALEIWNNVKRINAALDNLEEDFDLPIMQSIESEIQSLITLESNEEMYGLLYDRLIGIDENEKRIAQSKAV
ncbi:MAG: hypothetical protein WC730_00035 [Patescibacteria group bacterium]|jgi:hypothetical protein